jgi:toxin-antitoxin system PIN domain toxin
VILVDANLLIYSHNEDAPEHAAARAWFEATLGSPSRVGLPWSSVLAFVRIASNPALFRNAASPLVTWRIAKRWLERPNVWVPMPGPDHNEILESILDNRQMTSRLVPDAHLAALAMEYGLTLYSTDGDFAKIKGLRWINPLL